MKKLILFFIATSFSVFSEEKIELERDLIVQAVRQNVFVQGDDEMVLLNDITYLWDESGQDLVAILAESNSIDKSLAQNFVELNDTPIELKDYRDFSIKVIDSSSLSMDKIFEDVNINSFFQCSRVAFNDDSTMGLMAFKKYFGRHVTGGYLIFERIGFTWACRVIDDAPSIGS